MIKALAIFSAITWLTAISLVLLYRFEGDIYPVTSMANLNASEIRPHPHKPGWSLLSGDFDKYSNCVFLGLQWNFVAAENLEVLLVAVPSEFEGPPVHRIQGHQEFDLLAVKLVDTHDIMRNSVVYVYHDCYNGWLWNTRTVFYQSPTY
jgi:hypothetical protein